MLRLALLSVLMLFTAAGQAREVTVGLYENDPKIFRDAEGHPSGIFVALIERIAAEEDWHLSFRECAWADCLEQTARGEIDLMPDVAISDRREARLDFHTLPALHSWSQVYRRPSLEVESIFDLAGTRIALLEGSIQQTRIAALLDEFGIAYEPFLAEDFHAAFEAVSAGEADVALVNHLFGSRYHADYGLKRTPVVWSRLACSLRPARGATPSCWRPSIAISRVGRAMAARSTSISSSNGWVNVRGCSSLAGSAGWSRSVGGCCWWPWWWRCACVESRRAVVGDSPRPAARWRRPTR